jgi:hypothetical protein
VLCRCMDCASNWARCDWGVLCCVLASVASLFQVGGWLGALQSPTVNGTLHLCTMWHIGKQCWLCLAVLFAGAVIVFVDYLCQVGGWLALCMCLLGCIGPALCIGVLVPVCWC